MTYGWENANLSNLIKNFDLSDDGNYIVIHFLDGSSHVEPFSEQKIYELLIKEIEQAQIRQYKSNSKREIDKQIGRTIGLISFYIVALLCRISRVLEEPYRNVLLDVPLAILWIDGIVKNICFYKANTVVAEELKKYEIYLENLERLDKCDDLSLFDGVEMTTEYFDINTLDNYSLEEVEKIIQNLKEWEDFSKWSKTVEAPQLKK